MAALVKAGVELLVVPPLTVAATSGRFASSNMQWAAVSATSSVMSEPPHSAPPPDGKLISRVTRYDHWAWNVAASTNWPFTTRGSGTNGGPSSDDWASAGAPLASSA